MPRLLVLVVLVTSALVIPLSGSDLNKQPVTQFDLNALVQAIEDEIYDYGYQDAFVDVGNEVKQSEYQLQLYIQPTFNDQGLGWAIYKLMPYGEVLRMFSMDSDGLAVLGNDPEFGFPPTEPSYLTIYMDDNELCRDKQHWLRSSFFIDLHPSVARVRESEQRQKQRLGYSVRLDPSRRMYPPDHDPRCPTADSAPVSSRQPNNLQASPGYQDSLRAAQKAENRPDPTGGPMHFLLDYGQPLPAWAEDVPAMKTFGPFLKTLGGGAAPKDVKVQIVILP